MTRSTIMINKKNMPKKAVILAGGKGTRLGLKDRPKPMVLIDDRSLLQIQIEWLKREGIEKIFLLLNYLPDIVMSELGNGEKLGIEIEYIIEKIPLGTAGALAQLKGLISEEFFVIYGDLLCDLDLEKLAGFHFRNQADLTLVTHPNDHPYDSDLLELDPQGKVTKFFSKPHPESLIYKNLVNAAIYLFSEKALALLNKNVSGDLAHNFFPEFVKKLNIYSYKTTEYIKDMGTPDRLERVKKDLVSRRLQRLSLKSPRACVFWDRDGTIIEFVDNLISKDKVVLREGISEVVRDFNKLDVLNIVVTNQPMVSKGILSFTELEQIHNKIETLLGNQRAWLDEIYFCPHHPDLGFEGEIKELKIKCECRKPDVGMLNKAIIDFNINREQCFFIGDSLRDLECAKKFEIPFLGYLGGEELPEKLQEAAFISENILEIKNWIVNKLKL